MILHFLFAPLLLAKFFGQRTSIKTNIVPGSLLEFSGSPLRKTFRRQQVQQEYYEVVPCSFMEFGVANLCMEIGNRKSQLKCR